MSKPQQEMGSLEDLQEWCRVKCANYPNVEIKNMSTSFRDGLAFCAIIHKHRPDLIDFSSLSKDNVYQNNRLAFEVAETKLGIPALLDPKDMVSNKVPDRLTVITYVSQYYYFFNNKSHASAASLRSSHVTNPTSLTKSKTPDPPKILPDQWSSRDDQLSNRRPRGICALCWKPVHLLQRYLVDGKIYHRSCFRCKVCSSTLLPGSYKQGDDAGSLICTHHTTDCNNSRVDLSQQIKSADHLPKFKSQETGLSLGGLTDNITHPPYYTEKTESQDRVVSKRVETERKERNTRQEVKDREDTDSAFVLRGEVQRPAPPHPPPPRFKDRTPEGAGQAGPKLQEHETKTQGATGLTPASSCVAVSGGSSQPVPTPRRMLDSSAAPVPAPRTKKILRMNSASALGGSPNQSKPSPSSSCVASPTSASHKVKSNHPWLGIIHPGPWTQLPPAPAPTTPTRSSSVPAMQGRWFRSRAPPPNPFEEGMDDNAQDDRNETAAETEAANQTVPSEGARHSENGGNLPNNPGETHAPMSSSKTANAAAKSKPEDKPKPPDKPNTPKKPAFHGSQQPTTDSAQKDITASSSGSGSSGGSASKPGVEKSSLSDAGSTLVGAGATCELGELDPSRAPNELWVSGQGGQAGASERLCLTDVTEAGLAGAADAPPTSDMAHSCPFPSSVSVPAISSGLPQNDLREGNESGQATSSQSKACRENPFNQKPVIPKSKTFQALPSGRASAPGYGFPLIKRKVQTDQCLPIEDLQAEMVELNKHLERLELKGVELERSLRDCKNEKDEAAMLMDWFSLIHEKHVLVRRDAELVYLKKQQTLEEKQADVEYQLRCLLNKPETEWSEEDRGREQQLMEELVTTIEQRNQIISSLDQDRQREKEEDLLLDTVMKRKDFQKEGLKELKKSNGKFKPMKMLRMLSHKAESNKYPKDKKS